MGDRSREVYERLRAEIARGDLRPNERLVEIDLAARLSVSRTPVRESIQRLSAEGLVVNRRRAWFVREHSPAEIRAHHEVRVALEGYAAGLAAERASAAERRRILQLGGRSLKGGSAQPFAVHVAIADAAGNPPLAELLVANRDLYFNRRVVAIYDEDELQLAADEHAALADAVARGAVAEAEELNRRHVARSLDLALRRLA